MVVPSTSLLIAGTSSMDLEPSSLVEVALIIIVVTLAATFDEYLEPKLNSYDY